MLLAACSGGAERAAVSKPAPSLNPSEGATAISQLPVPDGAKLVAQTTSSDTWVAPRSFDLRKLKQWYVERLRPRDDPRDATVPPWHEWGACESPTTMPPEVPNTYRWGRQGSAGRLKLEFEDSIGGDGPRIVITLDDAALSDCYGAALTRP